MKRYSLAIVVLLIFSLAGAQSNDSAENRFKDGLYLNFNQVQTNKPIPKIQIRTSIPYSDIDFFEELIKQEFIVFYDQLGNSQKVKTEQIWGYCNRGSVYINLHDDFNRIPVLGSLSHFTATFTYTEYQSPYQYSSYYDRYYNTQQNKTELRQYILDFKTGKIYDFNYKAMEAVLAEDPDIMEEYSKLSKRKKRKLKFLYLRKYNEKHPLTFQNP